MKIVLAITGASGAIYAKLFLDEARNIPDLHIAIVASENGKFIFEQETGCELKKYCQLPTANGQRPTAIELQSTVSRQPSAELCSNHDFTVPFASGSGVYDAMLICPCSMGTLGRIAAGISNDVITRTADVFLKERRKLILVPRETPLSAIHLQNMLTLTNAGAIIMPAMPSFYSKPKDINWLSLTIVARIFDQLGFNRDLMKRWPSCAKSSEGKGS